MPMKITATHERHAILTAINLLDGKINNVIDSVKEADNKVVRLGNEVSQQTAMLTGIETRVRQLEIEKINEARIQSIEAKANKLEDKLSQLEDTTLVNTPKQVQLEKQISEVVIDLKPVLKFIDRAKFIMPLFTGVGGIIGAVIAAIVLKYLHIH